MDEHIGRRRALLRGGGALGVVAVGASALSLGLGGGQAQASTAVGPWTYVAPGESIQDAITAGALAIQLGQGTYSISAPIVTTAGLMLRGLGQRTRLVATATMSAMVEIGSGGPIDGVNLADLLLDCGAGKADIGIDLNIVGTGGNYRGEPDSVCRLDDLWVYRPVLDGIVYRGTDTQACATTRVRIREAGRYGFRVEAPDNWWNQCEATTTTQTGTSAGFYVGKAITGSNGIGAGNNFFQACKAWYCRDYGWHVKGNRNKFIGCEAQDIRSHGFYIEWDQNTFTNCVVDTAGLGDVGGVAGTADGFYAAGGMVATSIVGCQAFDRKPGGAAAQQRYGFNVPAAMVTDGLLLAPTGWNNLSGLVNQR